MNKYISLTLLMFLMPSLVFAVCDKVVPGYEKRDVMFVLCTKLDMVDNAQATKLVKSIMAQYKGPPDEILVHFVKSKSSVGDTNISPEEFVGYYYTHSNELVIWPEIKSKTKTFKIN